MGVGGEVVAEVAQGVLDRSEGFVVGQIDEFVGQAIEDAVGLAAQGRKDLLTAFFTFTRDLIGSRRGFIQHGSLPSVRSTVAGAG